MAGAVAGAVCGAVAGAVCDAVAGAVAGPVCGTVAGEVAGAVDGAEDGDVWCSGWRCVCGTTGHRSSTRSAGLRSSARSAGLSRVISNASVDFRTTRFQLQGSLHCTHNFTLMVQCNYRAALTARTTFLSCCSAITGQLSLHALLSSHGAVQSLRLHHISTYGLFAATSHYYDSFAV